MEQLELNPLNFPFPTGEIIQHVLNSGRLTFEDETTVRHRLALSQSSFGSPQWQTLITPQRVAFLGLGLTGSLLHLRRVEIQTAIGDLGPWTSRICFGLGVFGVTREIAKNILQRTLLAEVVAVVELLHEMSSLSRRMIQWVHDNEVIHRGYVVTTARLPESAQILSPRACLRLRRAVFLETRFLVFILRAAAVDLLHRTPKEITSDPMENHICLIPLEEFGDSLSIPESDPEAIYLSTDGFSLPALKSIIGLLDLQVSEFLKLLCSYVIDPTGLLAEFHLLRHLRKAAKMMLETFNRLDLEYKFETDEPQQRHSLRRQSIKNHVLTSPDYLRSLELHLTAALKDARIIIADDTEEDELQKVVQQDRLEKLGYHVKCCSMLLDHVKRKSVANVQTPGSDTDIEISPTRSDFELRDVARSDDHIHVEDEIFEAFILGDTTAEHRGEPVSSELNHYQDQKMQSKMVLEEIKALLSIRSADWKERERKARERQGLPPEQEETGGIDRDKNFAIDAVAAGDRTDNSLTDSSVFVLPSEIAAVAAAMSSGWNKAAETKFGSDSSEEEDADQMDESTM